MVRDNNLGFVYFHYRVSTITCLNQTNIDIFATYWEMLTGSELWKVYGQIPDHE